MRYISKIAFVFISVMLMACNNDDDHQTANNNTTDQTDTTDKEPEKSSAKQIIGFAFQKIDNSDFETNVQGIVDEQSKSIALTVPNGTDTSNLIPTIEVSASALVSPDGVTDFMTPVRLTVTAEDGSTVDYEVIVAIEPSSAKEILEFRFDGIKSEGADVTILAEIDEENKTIRATMPAGTDITSLEPSIEISLAASIDTGGEQDFTDTVNYKVTAEDGTGTTYQVAVDVELTEKEILLKIGESNGIKIMNWDEETDLLDFKGIQLNSESKVVEFVIDGPRINNLPPEIVGLQSLKLLAIVETDLATLPPEIGQLTSLESLILINNKLKKLPSEIGQLVNLTTLLVNYEGLSVLPSELGQLSNLKELELNGNELTSVPLEIGRLVNLEKLNMFNNKLSSLPPEIGQLVNLKKLNMSGNELLSIPSEIGQLTNLELLILNNNELESLPPEIGLLTNLQILYLHNNKLVSPPKEIGDLTNLETLLLGNNGILVLDGHICDLARKGETDIDIYGEVGCSTM